MGKMPQVHDKIDRASGRRLAMAFRQRSRKRDESSAELAYHFFGAKRGHTSSGSMVERETDPQEHRPANIGHDILLFQQSMQRGRPISLKGEKTAHEVETRSG